MEMQEGLGLCGWATRVFLGWGATGGWAGGERGGAALGFGKLIRVHKWSLCTGREDRFA